MELSNYEPEQLTDLEIEHLSEKEFRLKLFRRLDSIDGKVNPMYEIFNSVSGFNRISVWMLKILSIIGAGIVGLYAIIEFFRKLGTKQ